MATRIKKKPTQKLTMYSYLAEKVPSDVHFVLNKYSNYQKARSSRELENQIKHFVRNGGANALQRLAEIHPDRELIQISCQECKVKESKILEISNSRELKETILNDRNMYYNASGSENNERMINKMTINSVIVGGFVLMGIALMLKK
tara:strand:+ start:11555 stop:11995 length:441 start_codon:yes stop_codon:yes gene_type:complete